MQKKILIITDNLKNQINGVVTTFKNLEKYADRDGYVIHYITPADFSYIDCPGYPEVKLSWSWRISNKIKAIDPDHIHIATEGPVGLSARIWCERNRVPYNTSYHSKFPEFLFKIYKIPMFITYRYLRWFHRNSERVLATTKSMVKDLTARKFRRVRPWTRGVNRENLKSTISFTRDESIKPTILSVGRISKEKGLADLIPLQNDYDIIIVGDGPYREELQSKMPNAKFPGYKIGEELANCYAMADVFVFPSVTDTFGLVMIEAMSQGTPVAAYPVCGPIDVIDDGVTGCMDDDLSVAIKRCLELNRDSIREASEKWSWESCWKMFKDSLVPVKICDYEA